MFINRIELSALDRIKENFGGLLYTFEKAIVLGTASGCFLIWMMTKDLLAMGTLDLLFGCFVAVFGETKDSIVILPLLIVRYKFSRLNVGNIPSSLLHPERASLGPLVH